MSIINTLKSHASIYILSIFILIFSLDKMLASGSQVIQDEYRYVLKEKGKFIKQDIQMSASYLEYQSQQFLMNLEMAEAGLLQHSSLNTLQYFPQYDIFSKPPSLANKAHSNITGIGKVSRLTPLMKSEISAAMTLALWAATNDQHFEYSWAYYTSVNQFMVLAPYISVNDFQLKKSVFSSKIWDGVASKESDKQQIIFSELYNDSAGAGYMLSMSTPVYFEQQFMGLLSIDIGIERLKLALQGALYELEQDGLDAAPYIVNKNGMEVASPYYPKLNNKVVSEEQLKAALNKPVELDTKYLLSHEVIEGELYGILIVRKLDYHFAVAKSILEEVMIAIAFILCVLLVLFLHKRLGISKQIASIDALTELNNRRTLMNLGSKIISENNRIGIGSGCLVIDIDYFKSINDNFGHTVGDKAIYFVAQIIKSSFRKNDLVARYGGEEFVVLLSGVNRKVLLTLAEKLRKEIQDSQMESHSIDITVSIGCSLVMDSNIKLSGLIELADTQLYKAKEKGRNRVDMDNNH